MKTLSFKSVGGLWAAALLTLSNSGHAQITVTETSSATAGHGTITQYAPGQTIVVSQDSGTPVTYLVGKQTLFVDESGAPVAAEQITSGVPITVNYVQEGDRMVASRVVVKKTVSTTTTTTTTGTGTVSEFAPGSRSIVIRPSSSPAPLTYAVSSTTTYVDESGAPVAVEQIARGAPVTVHYVREGDLMVANRIVVTRSVTAPVRPLTEDERERREEAREEARERREEARERREEQTDD